MASSQRSHGLGAKQARGPAGARRATLTRLYPVSMGSYTVGGNLFLALEQLEAIRDLLRTKSAVKARMALILLDSLADAMLFRRLEQVYDAAEESLLRHKMPRYSTRERNLARQRFNRRVEIARRPSELDSWLGDGAPLIDEADATVLKVGHSYRNDAYHEDAHNAFVVSSVARVLFAAVARLVARMQRRGMSVGSISDKQIAELAEWGYETGSMLELRAAAEAVTASFIAELAVDSHELREVLAADLESRVDSLQSDLKFLSQASVDPAKIIEGVELWAHYGADEELLELAQRFDPLVLAKESAAGRPREELIAQSEAATERYRARMDELEQEHKQRVSFDLIERATQVASRLQCLNDPSRILVAYHDVDEPLSELEGYMYEAVVALDREIQHQIDLARGK
jgi:hypothetical protein